MNHNLNATYNIADAGGPVQRSLVMITCNGSSLAYGIANVPSNPYLKTILQAIRTPAHKPAAGDPRGS